MVFKIPDSIDERYQAHYFDFDLYGTVNFNDYVGAQIGYRSLDLGYVFEEGPRRLQGEGNVLRWGRQVLVTKNEERKTNSRSVIAFVSSSLRICSFARRLSASRSVSSFLL